MKFQFDALRSQLIQKQVENMDYYKIMDMHVPFYHEFNSKLNNSNMQAWNELYINMYELNQDLTLQLKHESCKNQFYDNSKKMNVLP